MKNVDVVSILALQNSLKSSFFGSGITNSRISKHDFAIDDWRPFSEIDISWRPHFIHYLLNFVESVSLAPRFNRPSRACRDMDVRIGESIVEITKAYSRSLSL